MSDIEIDELQEVQRRTFGSAKVEILPFYLERIKELTEGVQHIWHGTVKGEWGKYATSGGSIPDTHFVSE